MNDGMQKIREEFDKLLDEISEEIAPGERRKSIRFANKNRMKKKLSLKFNHKISDSPSSKSPSKSKK